jgi:hypothetical protein
MHTPLAPLTYRLATLSPVEKRLHTAFRVHSAGDLAQNCSRPLTGAGPKDLQLLHADESASRIARHPQVPLRNWRCVVDKLGSRYRCSLSRSPASCRRKPFPLVRPLLASFPLPNLGSSKPMAFSEVVAYAHSSVTPDYPSPPLGHAAYNHQTSGAGNRIFLSPHAYYIGSHYPLQRDTNTFCSLRCHFRGWME